MSLIVLREMPSRRILQHHVDIHTNIIACTTFVLVQIALHIVLTKGLKNAPEFLEKVLEKATLRGKA